MNLNLVVIFSLSLFGSCLSVVGAAGNFKRPKDISKFFERNKAHTFHLQIDGNWTKCFEFLEHVYIPDYDFFMDVIERYGNRITKIGVIRSDEIDKEQWTALFQRINERCADSLIAISLGAVKEYTFKDVMKPFTKVERLSFNIKTNEVGQSLALNEVFPNLACLRIDYIKPLDDVASDGTKLIEIELPAMTNLKQFNVFVQSVSSDAATVQKQIVNLFQKNPQIEGLWLSAKVNDCALQEIKKYLPNLKRLSFSYIHAEIQPVHFDGVRNFTVHSRGKAKMVEKMTFAHLDTLDFYFEKATAGDSWVIFAKNNQNIDKLDCKTVTEDGFVDIVAKLPNLQEVKVSSFEKFNIDFVSELIGVSGNISKMHYESNPQDNTNNYPDMAAFEEKFKKDWMITYDFETRPFVELEKKN